MPSFLHEAMVEMLRGNPLLAIELLRTIMPDGVPDFDAVVTDSADLGNALPPELAADCVLRLEASGRNVLAVVVEVQLRVDVDKVFSWPAYVIGARSRHRCDAILLIVTPLLHVATWARRPISLGPGTGALTAWVIGPTEMPAIEDAAEAVRSPELAVLSAIAHGHDDDPIRAATIATTAAAVAMALNDHRAQVYYDLIVAALSDAAREAMKMFPKNYEYQNEGLRKAKAEGRAEGKVEGKIEGRADALLAVLEARGFTVDAEARRRIFSCSNPEVLARWLRAAVSADSVETALDA